MFDRVTHSQAVALDALCEHGCSKRAARAVGLAPKTIANRLSAVRRDTGIEDRVRLAVLWDRYRRAG